ncbi:MULTISPECIES: heme utilization protein HutZ [Photobacterium]|uniref:HugZ protein n=1 Tax=Photobacterium halotolerans TaxID=265726 RepID=A0A0F5VCG4_9GAMM|nr:MULTISPECIES: heme utilization protein HutZ [Photobacterium]KKC99767.1 HugZ protein [Photobacterium halotolerans]UIP29233.1 heme utilization protein HutZ [Photobacterium sp. TLY01]
MSEVKQERLQNRLEPQIQAFRDTCQTLQLATVDSEGKPNVSYAPFALLDDGYYVLISKIARHARNLLENPQVSLMMIEDEATSKTIYARTRLTFEANVVLVERDTERWQLGVAALKARFGEIVDGLSGLEDFKLFRLEPTHGLFVKGFGQAFQVTGDDLVDFVHLTEGHKRIDKSKDVKSA